MTTSSHLELSVWFILYDFLYNAYKQAYCLVKYMFLTNLKFFIDQIFQIT